MILAVIVNTPGRFNYAEKSLKNQTVPIDEIKTETTFWAKTVGHKPFAKMIVEAWQNLMNNTKADYVVLCLGDYEVPTTFIERALKSGADVYGIPMLFQNRDNRIQTGLNIDPTKGYKQYPDYDDVYPDSPIFVKVNLAKEYCWSVRTLKGGDDFLNPFMVWADKTKNAKMCLDRGLVGIHHKV